MLYHSALALFLGALIRVGGVVLYLLHHSTLTLRYLGELNNEIAFVYDHDDSTGQAEPVEAGGWCPATTMPT